jgi:choline dehydrogenase-like flavoprotein
MRHDVLVVGGGTAGCVLAARLSEDPARSVCLLEAGPDYGPLADGRWPSELRDPRALPSTHDWGTGGEDQRSLGARVLGGSSAHNACAILRGSPDDYGEWGHEWAYERFASYLDRARAALQTTPVITDRPAPFNTAFLEAAVGAGFPLLDDPDDPAQPVGVAPFPANVLDGTRWNAAFAYVDPARERPNLMIMGETLVDRVLLDGMRATGVLTADGRTFEANRVVLTAGAYFSPAILVRSGIGPEQALRRLAIRLVERLPVGEVLLDHCGTGIAWRPSDRLDAETVEHERRHGLFEAHAVLKAASSSCPPGSWDIQLLSWTNRIDVPGRYEASAGVFHMKPRSAGRLHVTSTDPTALPVVERGFLSQREDLTPLVEAIEIGRQLAATEPLRSLLEGENRPGPTDLKRYTRQTVRNYFHPAGTCAMGAVVDWAGRVLGIERLIVADASIMPTLPRANTNLTTAAIAERVAELISAER